jgi:glucosamine 6-phosphate synthetase-like amidotransferase/phosphosugar isomerase protein
VLDVLAGPEYHIPTKTYVNSLAALMLLCSFIVDESGNSADRLLAVLRTGASAIRDSCELWREWGKEVAESCFSNSRSILFLATRHQLASAWQASMVCAEAAKTFSAALDWATFRHGFEVQVDSSFVAIGFRPSKTGVDVWQTTTRGILGRGGQLFFVPELSRMNECDEFRRSDPDIISPIWETLPIHWLCMDLAHRKGLDPSRIERKVILDI